MSLQGGYIRCYQAGTTEARSLGTPQINLFLDGLKGVPMSQVISDASKIIGPVGTTVSLVLFPALTDVTCSMHCLDLCYLFCETPCFIVLKTTEYLF